MARDVVRAAVRAGLGGVGRQELPVEEAVGRGGAGRRGGVLGDRRALSSRLLVVAWAVPEGRRRWRSGSAVALARLDSVGGPSGPGERAAGLLVRPEGPAVEVLWATRSPRKSAGGTRLQRLGGGEVR